MCREGGVGLAITAAVEAVSLIFPATGVEREAPQRWAKAASLRRRPGCRRRDEEGRGSVGPNAERGDEGQGAVSFDQGLEDGVSLISASRVRARRANMRKLNLVKDTTSRLAPGR